MSTKVTTWVWHSDRTAHLRGNAFVALLALADIADDDGHVVYAKGAKRTQEALAKKARMSVATFRRMTGDLAEQGLLSVSRESQRTENEYRIAVTAQPERSDLSGQSAHSYERSQRSLGERSSNITPLIGRSDIKDIPRVPFEAFWDVWPRKDGKANARRAWDRAVKRAEPEVIVAAAREYAESPDRPPLQFVPHGATWLNGDRWEDPAPMPREGVAAGGRGGQTLTEKWGAGNEWMEYR